MSDHSTLPPAPKSTTPQKGNRAYLLLGAGVLATAGAAGWWAFTHQKPGPQLEADKPLDQSTASITVLHGAPATGNEAAQTLTTSSEKLASQAQIALKEEETAAKPIAPKPVVFNQTAVQLGTTISLLVSSWPAGGTLPRELADTATILAEATGQHTVADAAQTLRNATPREGPVTLNLLLVEVAQALTLQPPANLPETDAEAEAGKSWLRKQLEQLVHISSTPQTQNRWVSGLQTVQQQIARGMVTDAFNTLTETPLAGDDRLSRLRAATRGYLDQTGKLNKLVTAYGNTFLQNQATGE